MSNHLKVFVVLLSVDELANYVGTNWRKCFFGWEELKSCNVLPQLVSTPRDMWTLSHRSIEIVCISGPVQILADSIAELAATMMTVYKWLEIDVKDPVLEGM